MVKKKVGQITVKKIGSKWAACISGTPQELFNSFRLAVDKVEKLRKKHGRRHYIYIKNKNHRTKK